MWPLDVKDENQPAMEQRYWSGCADVGYAAIANQWNETETE